jgi:hypothetical protein
MMWKNRLLIPIFAALIYLIASFFIQIVPCQISPNVPNPVYSWGLCSLNPDRVSPFGIQNTYWGMSPKLTDAYIISVIAVFVVVFVIMLIVPKTRGHSKKEEEH